MRTLQQIQRQEGVGYAQAKRVQQLEAKSELASARGSADGCDHCDSPGGVKTYANQACLPLNGRVVCIDWCIHQIVAALNAGGVQTVACCCGHGRQPGRIDLADGRILTIANPLNAPGERTGGSLQPDCCAAAWKRLALTLAEESQAVLENAHWEVSFGSGDLRRTIKSVRELQSSETAKPHNDQALRQPRRKEENAKS